MNLQEVMLNGTIKENGSILPMNGFVISKRDIVSGSSVLFDGEPQKFTWEPNPGFSTSGANNPFKPLSFTCQAVLLGPVPSEVADIVNFLLPWSASYRQVPFDLMSPFFHPALYLSRLLSNQMYEKGNII